LTRKRLKAGLAAALVLALVSGAYAQSAQDPVVAQRGSDHITLSQARAVVASLDPKTREQLKTDPSALTNVLRDVMLQRAVLKQANDEGWPQKSEVVAALQRLRDQLVAQSWLASKTAPAADYPSAAEVSAAYEQNKQRFLVARRYRLTQLFLKADPAQQGAAKAKLAALRHDLSNGHLSFETAVVRNHDIELHNLDWIAEDHLMEPVKSIIQALPEGMISDPVCTADGCDLFKLVATRAAGPADLSEVHDQLVKALREHRQQDLQRAFADSLLKQQPVQVNEITLSKIVAGGQP